MNHQQLVRLRLPPPEESLRKKQKGRSFATALPRTIWNSPTSRDIPVATRHHFFSKPGDLWEEVQKNFIAALMWFFIHIWLCNPFTFTGNNPVLKNRAVELG